MAAGLAERPLAGSFEGEPVSDWAIDQAGVVGILEHDPGPLNLIAQRHGATGLGEGSSEPLEVIAGEILDKPSHAKAVPDPLARSMIVGEGPVRNLAGFNQVSLGRQEPVQQVPDGQRM